MPGDKLLQQITPGALLIRAVSAKGTSHRNSGITRPRDDGGRPLEVDGELCLGTRQLDRQVRMSPANRAPQYPVAMSSAEQVHVRRSDPDARVVPDAIGREVPDIRIDVRVWTEGVHVAAGHYTAWVTQPSG